MTTEQRQTIKYYQTHKSLYNLLDNDSLLALQDTLGEYFDYIQNPPIALVLTKQIKHSNWKKEWKAYRREVQKISKQQPINTLPDADKPRASNKNHFYSMEYYVIDHIKSIWYGYKNNIPVEVIGDISNLRWYPTKLNSIKGRKCE